MTPAGALSAWAVQILCVLLADVLLAAGLEREHDPHEAVDVGGLVAIRPGMRRRYFSCAAKKAEARTAEVEPVAERLPLPHGDVDPEVARRTEQAERDRVALHDHERVSFLGGGHRRLEILHGAEEVRVLQEDGGDVLVDGRGQRPGVGGAVGRPISSIVVPQPTLVVAGVSRLCGCTRG